MTLTPAYGRDYKSAKAAKESFLGGQDWLVASVFHGQGYANVDDLTRSNPGQTVTLRYSGNRKVTTTTVPQENK